MVEAVPLDGGYGGYRCFRAVHATEGSGVELRALTKIMGDGGYTWRPGWLAAECPRGLHYAEPLEKPDWTSERPDRIPAHNCGCGFWAFKSLGELLRQEGDSNDLVYSLVELWGANEEQETGMRAEFAQIAAIIRPIRPEHLKRFPEEGLRASYPGVPIVKLSELKSVIEERGLTMLKRSPAPPALQWLTPEGALVWCQGPYGSGEENATCLPVAAQHPAETLTVETQRLKKTSFRDHRGRYFFWQRDESPTSRLEDFNGFLREFYRSGDAALEVHLERTQG